MNKLSKIFLGIIVVLVLALSIMIYKYIDVKNAAQDNLDEILKSAEELQKANIKIEELQNKLDTINNTINQ